MVDEQEVASANCSRGFQMTRTLVITVDQDNDLGLKTAIRGPVVGRKQVLTAALKLGIADLKKAILTLFLELSINTTT